MVKSGLLAYQRRMASALCVVWLAYSPPALAVQSDLTPILTDGDRLMLDRLAAPSIDEDERTSAYETLLALPEPRRTQALTEVVLTAGENYVVAALLQMIRDGACSIPPTVGRRLTELSEVAQCTVLGELSLAPDVAERLQIARNVLDRMLDMPAGADWSATQSSLASNVARILANSGNPSDHSRIRRALLAHPRNPALWLALVATGSLEQADRTLAKSVYDDVTAPRAARVATSLALAQVDPGAARFAEDTIVAAIDPFASQSRTATMAALTSSSGPRMANFEEYKEAIDLLGQLRFGGEQTGEKIAVTYLSAENEDVRMTAGLVLIHRRPERLLAGRPGKLSETEHTHLLCLIVRRHPDLTQVVREKLGEDNLAAGQRRLRQVGLFGTFGRAVTAASGF